MPCAGSAAAQSHKAKGRRLTPRSSGAPPAGHQARALLWFILHRAGLASCRRRPLTSNVMHPALVSIANITWLGCVPGIRAARVQASRQSNVQWPRGPVASVALRRCSKNMNLVAFHGRGPLSLQGSVRKPSAFDSSQQARARKPRKNTEILVELVCLTASNARAPGQWVEGALPFCLRSDTGATIYAELHIRVIASEARRTLNVRNGRFANHIAILQYQD